MSLRIILGSFLLATYTLLTAASIYVTHYLLQVYAPYLPDTVQIFIGPYPTTGLAWTIVIMLFALCGIAFSVLYFMIDRFLLSPVLTISKTLSNFASNGADTEIPEFSLDTKEMRSLGNAFAQFASRVNAVHKRDQEVSRVKSDFISTAAHQIRTPLTGIRWSLEALEKQPLTDDQKLLVKSAVDKSHDLVAIIGTLLDISSIESGKYKYKFTISDISTSVAQVVTDFMPLAQKSSVTLTYEKSPTPLPGIRVDAERIKWVLNNLLENAIRYTPAQGRVTVVESINNHRVIIQVKDTGIGIPESDRNSIFERFYRAGNAIAKENQGNGLGLYIARTIATDHGGDLTFATNPSGIGTTFTLSLPIAV